MPGAALEVSPSGGVTWDASSRPRYPVPRDVGYSPAEVATAQHLVDIHDALRAELTQLRAVLDQVRRGLMQVGQARSVLNTMTMRQNNWTLGAYCESYCRIVTGHHTLEDRSMLRHLAASDPASVPVVERLHEEHEVVAELLELVDRDLVALVSAVPPEVAAALAALESTVDTLSTMLLSHLRYEETELRRSLATHGMHVG